MLSRAEKPGRPSKLFDFGGEGEAGRDDKEIKRLHPEMVARRKGNLRLLVPQDESKHAHQPVERGLAPLGPGGEQYFGVGLGVEAVPRRSELFPQFEVVVDLAIVDDPIAAVDIGHRLQEPRPTDR